MTDPFGRVTTHRYDIANRLVETTLPNGVVSSYTYDARHRVLSITHRDAGGGVLASATYERAASGEPTRITREDGSSVRVGYDAALRVVSERYFDASDVLTGEIAYTYDRDGNRRTRTTSDGVEEYVYDTGSRLVRIERAGVVIARYDYDAGGRVTRIERGGRAQRLAYDADDHLVAVEDELTGDGARLSFDAQGRRVAREERVAGATTRSLSWAVGPTLVQSLESPHAVSDGAGELAGYVFDGEHPMARYDAAGAPVYYLRDAMGSVIGLVDGAGDSARIHYDGFGNVLREDGALAALPASLGGDFRFQGMWQDPGSGLYYVRARTYEPNTGRFTSRDPATGQPFQPERFVAYGFANQNGLHWRDPTGTLSMPELNVSFSIQSVLSAVARATPVLRLVFVAAVGVGTLVLMSKGGKSRPGAEHQAIIAAATALSGVRYLGRGRHDGPDDEFCAALRSMYHTARVNGEHDYARAIKFVMRLAGCWGTPP